MFEINPKDRWDILQVENEFKRINLKSADIYEGKYPDL